MILYYNVWMSKTLSTLSGTAVLSGCKTQQNSCDKIIGHASHSTTECSNRSVHWLHSYWFKQISTLSRRWTCPHSLCSNEWDCVALSLRVAGERIRFFANLAFVLSCDIPAFAANRQTNRFWDEELTQRRDWTCCTVIMGCCFSTGSNQVEKI